MSRMNPCERHENFPQQSRTEQERMQRPELFVEEPVAALCRRLDEILAEAFRQAHDQPAVRQILPAPEREFSFRQRY